MNQFRIMRKQNWLSHAEDVADDVLRATRHSLPTIGRLLLVATFLDDSWRIFAQWSDQQSFIVNHWTSSRILAFLWTAYMLVAQLVPALLVIGRRHVEISCGFLLSVVVVQVFTYHTLWSKHFFSRNMAVVGAVLLLLAECYHERPSLLAGLPRVDDPAAEPRSLMLLAGRSLVIFLFATLFRLEFSFSRTIELAVGTVLVSLVAVGWKTRLCALLLFAWLFIFNLWVNCFWTVSYEKYYRDFMKYDFFQTLSVMGGLLILVAYGPGGVSLDDLKKQWSSLMSLTLHTTLGDIKMELFCNACPRACENFLALCASDYYNNCTFHRNFKDFIVQTGDPTGTGKGGDSIWGGPFADEISPDIKHDTRGMVAMANQGPNTNRSQFYITYAKHEHLDGKNTVFARVIDGFDVLEELENVHVDTKYRPVVEHRIRNVTIHANPIAEKAAAN